MAETTLDELSVCALKRLEIARTLVTNSKILLFDEVVCGLDIDETEEVVDLIRDIANQGKTVFPTASNHVMRA